MADESTSGLKATALRAASGEPGGARMPSALRSVLLGLLGLLLAGAGYLIAVRGEALILDLGALSQRIFCF